MNARIADIGLDPEAIDGVFDSVLDPFVGIETGYLQEKYYRDKLGLIDVITAN